MTNIKSKIIAIAAVIFLVGCDDFFDINADPNNPTNAQLNTILPYAQVNLFNSFGLGTAGISELLSVYVHQTVQRGDHDDYKCQGNEFSLGEAWDNSYTISLPDLNQIIDQATEEGRPAYAGIAKLLKAHMFALMADIWGDIPYSEAGNPVDFKFPFFDDDESIYADLFDLIDSGMADLNAGGATPGADDLVYAGNLDKWRRYGNSLKLNLYNKVRKTSLYNASEVNELLGASLISVGSEDFELRYTTSITPENRHPGFIREYAQDNPQFYVSPYFYLLLKGDQACQSTLMTGIADPRLPYYFYNQLGDGESAQNPISYRDGNFLSIWFGSFDRDPNEGFDQNSSQTVVGLYPIGGAYDNASGVNVSGTSGLQGAGYQRMLTASAVDFIRAELALTQATGEDARAMFESGMRKAFAKVNFMASLAGAPSIATDAIDGYVNAVLARYDAANNDGKLEHILTQKWIQEFGFAIESYSDIRRTGYPQVCDPAQDLNEFSIQTNPYPVSLFYSTNDISNNGNSPGQRNPYSDKVFWDVD